MIHINMFGWTLIGRQRRFVVLVDWTMSEDEKNVLCVRVSGGVVGKGLDSEVGGGQVSVVDGTVVLRASICETEWEVN